MRGRVGVFILCSSLFFPFFFFPSSVVSGCAHPLSPAPQIGTFSQSSWVLAAPVLARGPSLQVPVQGKVGQAGFRAVPQSCCTEINKYIYTRMRTHRGWQIKHKWGNGAQRNRMLLDQTYLPSFWPLEDKNIPGNWRALYSGSLVLSR